MLKKLNYSLLLFLKKINMRHWGFSPKKTKIFYLYYYSVMIKIILNLTGYLNVLSLFKSQYTNEVFYVIHQVVMHSN